MSPGWKSLSLCSSPGTDGDGDDESAQFATKTLKGRNSEGLKKLDQSKRTTSSSLVRDLVRKRNPKRYRRRKPISKHWSSFFFFAQQKKRFFNYFSWNFCNLRFWWNTSQSLNESFGDFSILINVEEVRQNLLLVFWSLTRKPRFLLPTRIDRITQKSTSSENSMLSWHQVFYYLGINLPLETIIRLLHLLRLPRKLKKLWTFELKSAHLKFIEKFKIVIFCSIRKIGIYF